MFQLEFKPNGKLLVDSLFNAHCLSKKKTAKNLNILNYSKTNYNKVSLKKIL